MIQGRRELASPVLTLKDYNIIANQKPSAIYNRK